MNARTRDYALFVAHSIAYSQAFKLPHRDHARQRERLRIHYPIAIDRAIGRGVVPNARLQRLRRRPRLRAVLDRALGATYFAWAPQRHISLLWLIRRDRVAFRRGAVLVSAVFDLTLAFQWAVPTAPPWWSGKYGFLQDGVDRVTIPASQALPLVPHENANEADESNPFASMPSPHTATAVAMALALADEGVIAGALGTAYAATLAVALVYLGEHYVCDVLAGTALAAVLHQAVKRIDLG